MPPDCRCVRPSMMTTEPEPTLDASQDRSVRLGYAAIGGSLSITLSVIWLVAACLYALIWWNTAGQISDNRKREIDGAKTELANLTRVSQEHADRTFRSADQVIQFVRRQYLVEGARLDLSRLVALGVIEMENFNQIGIIDAQGVYSLANLPTSGRIDLSDREHFKVHVNSSSDRLFVSKPVLGRASGKWSIQLTRRITRSDGSFGGVVVLSIDPAYFGQFYRDLTLGEKGVSALYGMDGIARARRVGEMETHGVDASQAPMYQRIARGETSGVYVSGSTVDGIERVLHFRQLKHYPLLVVAGREMKEVLTNHERARASLLLQGASASTLILVLAGVASRYLWLVRREVLRRQRAELGQRVRTEQLDAVFDLSPDGFITFDRFGMVAHVSPAFYQMVAQADRSIVGLNESGFCTRFNEWCKADAQLVLPPAPSTDALISREHHRQVVALRGRLMRVLQVVSRVSRAGSVSRILYFRDITRESEVDRAKSEFLTTAAHELRTPMASIYGFAEVLLTEECEEASRQEFLEIILQQSQNISRILDDLLDLSRMEARRGQDFKVSRTDLRDVVRDMIRGFKPPIGRTSLVLDCPDNPVLVLADTGKLQQAVLNIVSNAYKYSYAHTDVSISVSLEARDGRPFGRVAVTDRGIGMNAEQRGRAFERFYRADQSGATQGTGLGLAIVKEIVELHGGFVALTSREGVGTTVEILLPANQRAPLNETKGA